MIPHRGWCSVGSMNKRVVFFFIALIANPNWVGGREMTQMDEALFFPSCVLGIVDTGLSGVLDLAPVGAAVSFTGNIALLPEEFSDKLLEDRLAGGLSVFGGVVVAIVAPIADVAFMSAEKFVDIGFYEEDYQISTMFYPKIFLSSKTAYEAFFDSDQTRCGRFLLSLGDG